MVWTEGEQQRLGEMFGGEISGLGGRLDKRIKTARWLE